MQIYLFRSNWYCSGLISCQTNYSIDDVSYFIRNKIIRTKTIQKSEGQKLENKNLYNTYDPYFNHKSCPVCLLLPSSKHSPPAQRVDKRQWESQLSWWSQRCIYKWELCLRDKLWWRYSFNILYKKSYKANSIELY